GDVIVKGRIDHEMEAILILYKYSSYLRYTIHWPSPLQSPHATRVSTTGVWYKYSMVRREGFLLHDMMPDDVRTAFGPAFIEALRKVKLPEWAADALPEWMRDANPTAAASSSAVHLPTVLSNSERPHYSHDYNDDIDNRNPLMKLPTLSPEEGGFIISMVIYEDALICLNRSGGCLIASGDGQFNILLPPPSDGCSRMHHEDRSLFWVYASSSSSSTQLWSSSCLPSSSSYTRPVELIRTALKYITRNNKVPSSCWKIGNPPPKDGDSTLRLLHEHACPNVGCFFCYQMPSASTSTRLYYRCLFADRTRITFFSSDKGGRGIDEVAGLLKYMNIDGEEKEMSWSSAGRGSIAPYVEAALAFVRWVIVEEDGGDGDGIDDRSVAELAEDMIQRSRDLRTIHELGGSCSISYGDDEKHAVDSEGALDATRAFLNRNRHTVRR
ncbi:hypothetical protein FOZ62_021599, partial [Perkinsus olseni]